MWWRVVIGCLRRSICGGGDIVVGVVVGIVRIGSGGQRRGKKVLRKRKKMKIIFGKRNKVLPLPSFRRAYPKKGWASFVIIVKELKLQESNANY
jgi:hypothetical protein